MADKDQGKHEFMDYLDRRTVKRSISGDSIIRKLETMLQKDKARQSSDILTIKARIDRLIENKTALKAQVETLRASVNDIKTINTGVKASVRSKRFDYELERQTHMETLEDLNRQKTYFSNLLNTQKVEQNAIKNQIQSDHDTDYVNTMEMFKDKAEVLDHQVKELQSLLGDKEAKLELKMHELETLSQPHMDNIALESFKRKQMLRETFWIDTMEREIMEKVNRLEGLDHRNGRTNNRLMDGEKLIIAKEQEVDGKIEKVNALAVKIQEAKQAAQKARDFAQVDTLKHESIIFEAEKEQEKLQRSLVQAEEDGLGELIKAKLELERKEDDHKNIQVSLDMKIYEMESKLKAIEDQRAGLRLKKSNLFDSLRYGIQEEIIQSVNLNHQSD